MKRIAAIAFGGICVLFALVLFYVYWTTEKENRRYHFNSGAEAKNSDARSWIPPHLPDDARDIGVHYDLDLNIAEGTFLVDSSGRAEIRALETATGCGDADVCGADCRADRTDDPSFVFLLSVSDSGRGCFNLYPRKLVDSTANSP